MGVGPGGYHWWYLDGLSDDGRHAITLIAFIGSVFSPYYAWSGRRRPENHCAINVALYGPGCGRWAMTERGQGALERDAANLIVGPSRLAWDGDDLVAEIDEIGCPIPRRLKGRLRLTPLCQPARSFALDAGGRHNWQPVAPLARITVDFAQPDIAWTGMAYLDGNWGTEPLEQGFSDWTWSRAEQGDRAVVLYDAVRRDRSHENLALAIGEDGRIEALEPPPATRLPRTGWRIERPTRGDLGTRVGLRATLEDTPFYARSVLDATLYGRRGPSVHESLSLTRFSSPVVRAMLPFRMPRRPGA
ncbi:carotenoid 1,2-hydratase [Zavarzinia sp. CC-PAN008]|uniref:carotenoid 1,2-hydratase n=1 Tax=Zavarzinia sp. CC-PAN008 TaxID=3243332 RepID=UPI003F744D86